MELYSTPVILGGVCEKEVGTDNARLSSVGFCNPSAHRTEAAG
jgi:hypothetical protein